MSSNKVVTADTYEELANGIRELYEKEEQLAAQLQLSKSRLQAAEEAIEALRNNRDALEKLLQKEATKLDQEDKKVAKVLSRLRTLQRKAKKAVRDYEIPKKKTKNSLITPEESVALFATPAEVEDAITLLTNVEVLRHDYLERLKTERKRLVRFIIALVVLPVIAFSIGFYSKSYTVRADNTSIVAGSNTKQEEDAEIRQPETPTNKQPESPQPESPINNQPISQPQKTYIVQAGDTLSGIAKFFYGEGKEWDRIYQANKQTLKDPHTLSVGQELLIP